MIDSSNIRERKREISNQFFDAQDIFVLLGDETRIKIICLLLNSPTGEMKVDDINHAIYLSRPAISHHLKALKESGVLKMREDSRYNYYSINKDTEIWNKLCLFFRDVDSLIQSLDGDANE